MTFDVDASLIEIPVLLMFTVTFDHIYMHKSSTRAPWLCPHNVTLPSHSCCMVCITCTTMHPMPDSIDMNSCTVLSHPYCMVRTTFINCTSIESTQVMIKHLIQAVCASAGTQSFSTLHCQGLSSGHSMPGAHAECQVLHFKGVHLQVCNPEAS